MHLKALTPYLLAVILPCVLGNCGRSAQDDPVSALSREVREYLQLAVSLGERDPNALDFYYGPAAWVEEVRRKPLPLSELKQSAKQAIERLKNMPLRGVDSQRGQFLMGQLRAIAARADLLQGVTHTFDDESLALFGIHLPQQEDSNFKAVRQELDHLLPPGASLASRYLAFDSRFTIPPGRLSDVMNRALQSCREITLSHLRLPPGESVTIAWTQRKSWSAYSFYRGAYHSEIQINTDLGLTVDRALQLACHEGYPGHHVFNSLSEERLVHGRQRPEFLVQPTFSPQSFVSEGAATVAAGVAFTEAARVKIERELLFPLAGLNGTDAQRYVRVQSLVDSLHPEELSIAREYINGNLEFARASDALERRSLMSHTDATLRYLNEYRTYVVTYTEGRDRVQRWMATRSATMRGPDAAWRSLLELIDRQDLFRDP